MYCPRSAGSITIFGKSIITRQNIDRENFDLKLLDDGF